MKLFECQKCGQVLHFENTRCESCGSRLGYLRVLRRCRSSNRMAEVWRALAEPEKRYRFCANAQYDGLQLANRRQQSKPLLQRHAGTIRPCQIRRCLEI